MIQNQKNNILHGIDVTNINRKEFDNDKLVAKILTDQELKNYNLINDNHLKRMFIAKHWAIKEAIIKLLNNNAISMKEINIQKINGQYICEYNDLFIKISTSYEEPFIFASAICLKD